MSVESSKLAKVQNTPVGTKSIDRVTISLVAITVLPDFIPHNMETIIFEGPAEDLHKPIEMLPKEKKK